MLYRFQSTLKKLASTEEKFLLAVSGGIDSMVLADLFYQSKISFAIAHCNFQLRGIESDKDAQHVKDFAERLNIPVYINLFDTKQYAEAHELSIQMAARELRYDWFHELQSEYPYTYLVTAHHSGDHTETMLLNFIKGKGLYSIAGIPVKNNNIIRPLLSFSKEEIISYAKENDIAWREDASNAGVDYERNFLRHKVIPLLKDVNPGLEQTMYHSSELFKETADFINVTFGEWIKHHFRTEGNFCIVDDVTALKNHPLLKNFIYILLTPYGFTPAVIRQIAANLDAQPGTAYHSSTHQLIFDRNSFYISRQQEQSITTYSIKDAGTTHTDDFVLNITPVEQADFSLPANYAFADAEKLAFPLEVRHWKEGDRFMPLGMTNFKKLSDFFTDNKVPSAVKNSIWLLTCKEEIVWIIGHRIDQRFALTNTSKTILKITFVVP